MKKFSIGLITATAMSTLISAMPAVAAPPILPPGYIPPGGAPLSLPMPSSQGQWQGQGSTPNQQFIANANPGSCLPLNQAINFTIQNAFYDSSTSVLAGGQMSQGNLTDPLSAQLLQGHINDMNNENVPLSGNVGTEFLAGTPPSPASQNDPLPFTRTSVFTNISLIVNVDPNNTSNATIHGTLTLQPMALAYIEAYINHQTAQTNPSTGLPMPQVNNLCVQSIGVEGKPDSNPSRLSNFRGTVILYMNNGNTYQMEAENTEQQTKPKLENQTGDDAKMAELTNANAANL